MRLVVTSMKAESAAAKSAVAESTGKVAAAESVVCMTQCLMSTAFLL